MGSENLGKTSETRPTCRMYTINSTFRPVSENLGKGLGKPRKNPRTSPNMSILHNQFNFSPSRKTSEIGLENLGKGLGNGLGETPHLWGNPTNILADFVSVEIVRTQKHICKIVEIEMVWQWPPKQTIKKKLSHNQTIGLKNAASMFFSQKCAAQVFLNLLSIV